MLRYQAERSKLVLVCGFGDLPSTFVLWATTNVGGINLTTRSRSVGITKIHRLGRLLVASALGVGLFLILSTWLGGVSSGITTDKLQASGPYHAPVDTTLTPDPRVAVLMEQITTGTVIEYERVLTGEDAAIISGEPYTIYTRYSYSGEPISMATRFAMERFQELGLDVGFHKYAYAGHDWRNVVAERPGLRRPDEVFLITAHLDDMPSGPVAPGADDNASGSTAVLVAAELLNQLDFDCTLRFVLFTGEEQGLRGSAAYATDAYAAGDNIRGVLNLDMIGYNSDAEPIIDLYVRSVISGSLNIAQTFSQVVSAYNLNLRPEFLVDNMLGNYSDNKSFWDKGYAAILAIEDYDDFTPYYHSVNDRLDTLDLDYFVEAVRASVGTFAHMGCMVSTGLLSGTVTTMDTGLPVSATVTAGASGYTFTAATDSAGRYSLTLPVDTYTVWAESVLPDYLPVMIPEVSILTDTITLQDFALTPIGKGMLTGTVTALDTGLPISATVTASAAADDYASATGVGGVYSLTLPAGTYTLVARPNLFDYRSETISGVVILTDTTTMQDLIVEPWLDLFFIPAVLKGSR